MSKRIIATLAERVKIEPCASKGRPWAGVYVLQNTATDRIYVGSTTHLERRVWEHLHKLRAGRHENPDLQADYIQYGEGAFMFYVLEECPAARLKTRELHWTTMLRSAVTGYNIRLSTHEPATAQQARNVWARVFAD